MRLLFICGRNRRRSPTAEAVVRAWEGVEADSAGVRSDAEVFVTLEQVLWADLILLMEMKYRRPLQSLFGKHLRDKRIVSLDIKDEFEPMAPELIVLIEKRVKPFVR